MTDASTSSNHRSIHAELITLAAEFARGAAVPDWSNHKWYSSTPHSERREILKTLRDIEETMRLYAIRLRDIADKVSAEMRPAEKPACDGCGLPGTARCPHCQAVTCGDCSTCEHFRGLVPRGPTPVETSEPPHELRPLLDNGLKALDAGVPIQPTSYFHEELKRLLAMPSEEPRETLARRCHCGEFEMQPDMALITDSHAHDHVFDGTKCDCEDTPECSAVEPTPPLNAAEMGTVARMAAVAARVQPVKATASQKCEWGCHVHWSGWPTSHHPSCTVNGETKHGD